MSGKQRSNVALVIFTKAPIPGEVKTRLCPPLTLDEAAGLHGSFVLDAVERGIQAAKAAHGALDRYLACAPSPDLAFFKVIEGRYGFRLLSQIGADLGARMAQVFESLFADGYGRVLLVGTDVPTLPGTYYTRALQTLGTHNLALGPAQDGGYHLIGLTKAVPSLFTGLPWSTDQVLSLTIQKAEALGLRTALLPAWRDVDTIEDLEVLSKETDGSSPLVPRLTKRTAGVLRLLAGRIRERKSKEWERA